MGLQEVEQLKEIKETIGILTQNIKEMCRMSGEAIQNLCSAIGEMNKDIQKLGEPDSISTGNDKVPT